MENECSKCGILKIGKPFFSVDKGKSRVTASIVENDVDKELWFEVDEEYGQYLCHERSDAYLVGLLWIALTRHYDIVCEAPVTGELLHQIKTCLIPALVKGSKVMRAPEISCPTAETTLSNVGAVGTGMSCGIDSFHSLQVYYKHPVPSLRLTHLTVFNVGAFGLYDINKAEPQFKWQVANSKRVADELGLKLVVGNSNLKVEFFTDFRYTHTYCNMFAVFMLQKLWGRYFYSSSGLDMSGFSVRNADRSDCAHYDLLSFSCYSTSALKIHSTGMAETRYDKTCRVVEFPLAKKYLQVCCQDNGKNCGKCFKCKRTLVCLDALGVLNQFGDVFDIEYYRAHRNRYMVWLAGQIYGHTVEYELEHEVFSLLCQRQGGFPWYGYPAGMLLGLKERAKVAAKKSFAIYRLYGWTKSKLCKTRRR